MSTRQNKKQRKGRNNANNRERTVTTLTEDPHTHYLIPTPSEEPAGSHITTQFAGPVGGKMHNMSMGPQSYQIPGNFGFGYPTSFVPPQHATMHQQQQSQQPPYYPSSPTSQHQPPALSAKPALPPGKNDLEILQNLKKLIKDGQHPFYRAVPSPAALANLYKGTMPTQSAIPICNNFPSSSEVTRKQSLTQGKDSRPVSANRARSQELNNVSQTQFKNVSASSVANLKLGNLKISRESSGPPSAGVQPEVQHSDLLLGHPAVSPAGADVSDSQHPSEFGYRTRSRYERKDSGPMDIEPGLKSLPPGSADAASPGNDDSSHPWSGPWTTPWGPDRTDDRDLASERELTPNPYHAGVNANPPKGRRAHDLDLPSKRETTPNPYLVGGELPHSRVQETREWFANNNARRVVYDHPHAISSDEPHWPSTEPNFGHASPGLGAPVEPHAPLETNRSDVKPPDAVDAHERSPHIAGIPAAREIDTARRPIDSQMQHDTIPDSYAPPPPAEQLASDMDDIQSSRGSSVSPANISSAPAPVPPGSTDMPPPFLKERIDQPTPPQSRLQNEVVPAGPGHPPPPHPERFNKKKFQKGHHFNGPNKFGRQGIPPEGASGGHGPRTFRPRSPSLDTRKARDFRGAPPVRAVSRDRGNYRPDLHDPRRTEGIDADLPPPVRYDSGRSYNEFSSHPSNERRPSYPSLPPPISGGRGPSSLEGPPGRGDYYSQYPPLSGRGDWDIDDEYYKSRGWDRPSPGTERERFDRDYPPRSANWDIRPEREFIPRDGYPPLAGPPSDERYQPGPPLPHNGDRAGRPPPPGPYNPPYGRVRPRSPSPMARPSATPIDDARPQKRPREDYSDYYTSDRAPPRRPPASNYPPLRSGSQSEWPPLSASPSAGLGGGPPPPSSIGRDYQLRDEYAPPGYERPRSPPGRMPYPRGSYVRGGDRGGYGMRPPQ